MTLEVRNVSSGYRKVPVIKEVDFTIEAGEIVGLIGLNGAGKSTLLKTILGLLEPQAGSISMNGVKLNEDHTAYAQQIAYIPETPVLYEELTLLEHLEMTALGYGIPKELVMERAQPLLEIFRLDQNLNWFPAYFSKGMKQKVMIICALVVDAKLLIIDEPFLGLDPLGIRDFIQILEERAAAGVAVLFTTHVLSIAEDICDRYLLMQAGRLLGDGQLSALQAQFNMPDATLDDIYVAMTQGKAGA